jgi:hypothetical protein
MFKKDSILVGILAGICLPGLVLLVNFLVHQQFAIQKSNDVYYFAAIALNLIAVRFAYTYHVERLARGIIASSFVICLLVFYLSKQAL